MQKPLGQLASELRQIARAEEAGYEDISLMGAPSECGRIVHKAALNKYAEFEKRNRIKIVTVIKRIQQRTSDRWVYYNLGIPL